MYYLSINPAIRSDFDRASLATGVCVWVVLRIWDFYVTADMSVLLFLLLLSTQVSLIRRALRRASVSRFRQDCKVDSKSPSGALSSSSVMLSPLIRKSDSYPCVSGHVAVSFSMSFMIQSLILLEFLSLIWIGSPFIFSIACNMCVPFATHTSCPSLWLADVIGSMGCDRLGRKIRRDVPLSKALMPA